MQEKLLRWLDKQYEMRADIKSDRQLLIKAGLSHSVISKARIGTQAIGPSACVKMADALNVSQVSMLVMGEHIDEPDGWDESGDRLLSLFARIPENERDEVFALLQAKVNRDKR